MVTAVQIDKFPVFGFQITNKQQIYQSKLAKYLTIISFVGGRRANALLFLGRSETLQPVGEGKRNIKLKSHYKRSITSINTKMDKKIIREAFFYNDYFLDFYNELDEKTRLKIDWTIDIVETTEIIPKKYFKHLTGTGGLYEIRVDFASNIFRIFSFFDEGKLIVIINAFQKKSQKTPKKEIERALKIKKQYFDEKSNKK